MKKKLKGLIAIYLACILLMATPLSTIAANTAMLYEGSEPIVVGDNFDHSEFDEIGISFTKGLNKQITVTVPDDHKHTGWKIWKGSESGGINFYEEPDEKKIDFVVSKNYYNEITENYLFVIEPVFEEIHNHTYSYSADGAVITETYSCSCDGHNETAEVKAPENLLYNGKAKKATVSYSENFEGGKLDISYDNVDLVNCGSITASIEIEGETASVTYEIEEKPVNKEIKLTKPRANKTPVEELETTEYTATVTWDPVVNEGFNYETIYTAEIVITPNQNYTYEGVEFSVPGATSVTTLDGAVTAEFPKTGKKSTGRVTSGDEARYFNIQFETNGGSDVKMQSVEEGEKVTEPDASEKGNAEFEGWYIDSALTEEYDFGTKVEKGFTLYAKWTEDDGEKTKDDEIEEDKEDKDKESGSAGGGNGTALCSRNIECPITSFKDGNAKAWYHDGVHYVLDKGYMIGYSKEMFHPNDILTRGMIITILWRIAGEPSIEYELKFTDVDKDAYYVNPLKWAVSEGIVAENDEFKPDEAAAREYFATLLFSYAKYKGMDVSEGENTNILSYEDAFDITEEAIPAMQYVAAKGIVIGKTSTTLNPKDSLTRAEFAEMIYRFLEK